MARVILDTGPLYAMLDRREKHHSWALDQLCRFDSSLFTCDAVLTEAFFLLENARASRQLGTFLLEERIISTFDTQANIARVLDLMDTYRNVPMSFADACLVCMAEDNPGSPVFTLNRDFTIYRQQRRRLIPLIAPF
jgi:predicted nucleic acid-binding protein